MSELYQSPRRGATHVPILPEQRLDEIMTQAVEPMLQKYRNEGCLTIVRGMRLSYEYYLCADPVGAVVISHGFTESAEKFREMTYYFLQAGYSVFALDHRGHGNSHREMEHPGMVHIGKFQDYVNDFDLFIKRIVRPHTVNLPLYLFGHSMGGAVGAMYLSQHPVTFRRAILNAPMIAPKTAEYPGWLAELLALLMYLSGNGKKRVLNYGDFDKNTPFEASAGTSKARFDYYHQKRVNHPHLQTTTPTYGWLLQAVGVTRTLLNRRNCATVQAPVLLFQAEIDDYVHNEAQEKYIARIPHGELVRVKKSKHEIYLSKNDILQPYLDQILSFFSK